MTELFLDNPMLRGLLLLVLLFIAVAAGAYFATACSRRARQASRERLVGARPHRRRPSGRRGSLRVQTPEAPG